MKILIFGASGRHLVSQALRSGHLVTPFVRHASKLPIDHENITIIMGDVTDSQLLENAITNQEVILSALGASTPFKRDCLRSIFQLLN